MDWTADDHNMYMADLVEGELDVLHGEIEMNTFTADAEELFNAFT
jgi:hypothetical protein